VPPKSKRAEALAAAPTAKKAAAYLKRNGQPEMASALQDVLDFALQAARQQEAAATRESGLNPNHALYVERSFREHVTRSKTTDLPDVVVPYLERYLAGQWEPERPQRARRHSNPDKANINIRIDKDLWDAVDQKAKDPAGFEARGYKLNAMQVAIGALRAEYGDPDQDTDTTA
jgi:murein L,D-transpeptidase YcbB/YkuD